MVEFVTLPSRHHVPMHPSAKAPSSGIQFARFLMENGQSQAGDGTVVDLGAGYYGVLGNALGSLGWKCILVEPNPAAAAHLHQHFPFEAMIVTCTVRDFIPESPVDVIVSNPAQMPRFTAPAAEWNHDVSGEVGRDMLFDVLGFVAKYLKPQARCHVLVFEFHRTWCLELAERLNLGLQSEFVMQKPCSPGGVILANLGALAKIFPETDWDQVATARRVGASCLVFGRSQE